MILRNTPNITALYKSICHTIQNMIFLLLFLSTTKTLGLEGFYSSGYPNVDRMIRQEHILNLTDARSILDCGSICGKTENCLSFAFNHKSKVCHLFSELLRCFDLTASDPGETDLAYYDIDAAERCPCNYNFQKVINICYNFHPANGRTWSESNQICQDQGGVFIKIDSLQRQRFVENFLDRFTWNANIWIQGQKINGKWQYDDGTIMTYFNWYSTDPNDPEPDNTANQIVIGLFQSTQFQWHDRFQSKRDSGFICEIL